MKSLPLLLCALALVSCNRSHTTIASSNEPVTLTAIDGDYTSGSLHLQYHVGDGSKSSLSTWHIKAPYTIKVSQGFVEIQFSGLYRFDDEMTSQGPKRLFIKKELIHTLLLDEKNAEGF